MADDPWWSRFFEDWLKENPQPVDEHGHLIGKIPDAFFRADYIETEVRLFRNRLEAKSDDELDKELSTSLERYIKLYNRNIDLVAAGLQKRQRNSKKGEIIRKYEAAQKAGSWGWGSISNLAGEVGLKPQYVGQIIARHEKNKKVAD